MRLTLGERDSTYYLSTKPAEPVRRSAECFTPDAQEHSESSSFQLGAGEYQLEKLTSTSRATIYTAEIGNESYAVKLGGSPDSIVTEFLLHELIFDTFGKFWQEACPYMPDGEIPPIFMTMANGVIGMHNSAGQVRPAGYIMECIPPFPADHAQALMSRFISPSVVEDPNLSRLRLQVHMSELSPENQGQNTNLLFRPVYFDELWHEAEDLNFSWAMSMGVTLAILHWGCGIDARGVKFLLAPGSMDSSRIELWITSFDHVQPFELGPTTVQSLVDAVISNPAWPRPNFGPSIMELAWECFYNSYLAASQEVMLLEGMDDVRVADEFIYELASAWALRPSPGRARTHNP
ncbi:hypothetical protein FDECE_5119 [Fusarium decemcellulare]|nr:hypothetical protein FDECE_5119 [Fusarium decemcellulare]